MSAPSARAQLAQRLRVVAAAKQLATTSEMAERLAVAVANCERVSFSTLCMLLRQALDEETHLQNTLEANISFHPVH